MTSASIRAPPGVTAEMCETTATRSSSAISSLGWLRNAAYMPGKPAIIVRSVSRPSTCPASCSSITWSTANRSHQASQFPALASS